MLNGFDIIKTISRLTLAKYYQVKFLLNTFIEMIKDVGKQVTKIYL
jgi:hypothetical protein